MVTRHTYVTFTRLSVMGEGGRVPRLALLALCAFLALAGCTASARSANPGRQPAGANPASATVSAAIPCAAAELRIRAGREGDSEGAHGDVEFTNVGSRPCVLRGLPRVAIIRAGGGSLAVRLLRAPNVSLRLVVLPSGRLDAADLVIYWANWCGRPPGPLSIRVTLPAGGAVTGPFNGPPDYNFVPDCIQHGQPSTVSVIDAYGPDAIAG